MQTYQLRFYPVGLFNRFVVAGSLFFNLFRVLIFGEVVFTFKQDEDKDE